MASGKSRIGAMLASKLHRPLYDLDALIEKEQATSIKEIFRKKGELYFRGLELQTIKKLAHIDNAIIVCGGGVTTFFESLSLLRNLGELFYLDANFALILERLEKSSKRPLGIHSQADIGRLKSLYLFRRPLYMSIAHNIDVNHENREQTCTEIITRFNALKELSHIKSIMVNDGQTKYNIFLTNSSDKKLDAIINYTGLNNHRIILVTSDTLSVQLKPFIDKIINRGNTQLITIQDGEKHKNSHSIEHIYRELCERGCNRSSLLIALGGGNVGDVAGFAAATFMRGIPVIQMPTTLLAMVDSSVGGKTGIDLEYGKNLVGAFHNPKAVIIDTDFLKTLPEEEFACGMAEIIKHAIIGDPQLFSELEHEIAPATLIERAVRVKTELVFADPRENNVRAHLNLGHTFAHAIEKVSNYTIKHGQAVAMGLVLATNLSHKRGFLANDFRDRLLMLLKKYNLPTELPPHMDKKALIDAMAHDKKRDSLGLKFILPWDLGDVRTSYVDEHQIF